MVFAAPDDAGGTGYFDCIRPRTERAIASAEAFRSASSTRRRKPGTWASASRARRWFETFTANVTNKLGQPEVAAVNFDYPLILSLGTAYTGIRKNLALRLRRAVPNYAGTTSWQPGRASHQTAP